MGVRFKSAALRNALSDQDGTRDKDGTVRSVPCGWPASILRISEVSVKRTTPPPHPYAQDSDDHRCTASGRGLAAGARHL